MRIFQRIKAWNTNSLNSFEFMTIWDRENCPPTLICRHHTAKTALAQDRPLVSALQADFCRLSHQELPVPHWVLGAKSLQPCPTSLCIPMDWCIWSRFSAQGILQTRILSGLPFSRPSHCMQPKSQILLYWNLLWSWLPMYRLFLLDFC